MIIKQPCAIAIGSLAYGIKLIGPFDNRRRATAYGLMEMKLVEFEVINIDPIEHAEWLSEPEEQG